MSTFSLQFLRIFIKIWGIYHFSEKFLSFFSGENRFSKGPGRKKTFWNTYSLQGLVECEQSGNLLEELEPARTPLVCTPRVQTPAGHGILKKGGILCNLYQVKMISHFNA